MSSDEQKSSGSFSSRERGPASPPYTSASQYLPAYQSRTAVNDASSNSSSNQDTKGKMRSAPTVQETVGQPILSEPRVTMSTQGPRIALTDPLNEIRQEFPPDAKKKVRTPGVSPARPPFSRHTSDASSFDESNDNFFDEFDWSEDEQEQQAAKEEEKQNQAIALRRKKISSSQIKHVTM